MGALQLLGASLGIFLSSRLPAGDLFALGWFVLAAAVLGICAFALFLSLAGRQKPVRRTTEPVERKRARPRRNQDEEKNVADFQRAAAESENSFGDVARIMAELPD